MIAHLLVAFRGRAELAIGAAIVALFTVAVTAGLFFQRDDLLFAQYFTVYPPDVDALTRSWFGHLMPGYIASVIAFLTVFGLSWPAAVVFTTLIHTGAFVAFVRCVDAVVGRARLNVLAGLAFSLSLGLVAVRLWWSATLNNMFALALGLAVLGCATRWLVSRRRRHLVAAVLLYALALSMSEKNLLFAVYVAGWAVLVVWRGAPLRERMRQTLRAWPLWVGLAVPALIDAAAFVTGPYVDESGAAPSIRSSAEFIVHVVLGGIIPSLFGFNMAPESTALLDPRVILPVIALLALIVWTTMRVRRNAGVWAFALLAMLLGATVLSRRADAIGIAFGRELRYHIEATALVWLALAVILVETTRHLVARRAAAPARRSAPALLAGVLACVVLIGSAVAWTNATLRTVQSSAGHAARAWHENLRATLPNPAPLLIDTPLPKKFGMPELYPLNTVAALLPGLGWSGVRTTPSLDGDAWVVGRDGVAGPARAQTLVQLDDERRCATVGSEIALPWARTHAAGFLVIEVEDADAEAIVVVASGMTVVADLDATRERVAVYLPAPIDAGMRLVAHGGSFCTTSISTARLLPEPR